MAGKMPSRFKERTHNTAMPYARTNRGLLHKVASKFKHIFVPTWLENWLKTEEDIEEIENDIHSSQVNINIEDNDNSTEVVYKQKFTENSRCKNINDVMAGSSASFWLGPSTSREPDVSTKGTEISSIVPNCDVRSAVKDDSRIVNGDDHSENSDNSASTSGCSSLISSQEKAHRSIGLKISDGALEELRGELMRKSTQMRKPQMSNLSTGLFSRSISDVEASNSSWLCNNSTQRKVFPRPSHSNRPAFNVSSYGKPSLVNDSNSVLSSPFYNGGTTIGGSSGYRRPAAPYTVGPKSLRNRFRVREKPSDNFPCLSTSARRILNALQTMSTPLNDAKKIPVTFPLSLDNPLTLNPPSQRLQPFLSTIDRSNCPSGGPPPVNLSAVSKVPLLKNRNSRNSKNLTMEIPTKPCLNSEECIDTAGKTKFNQVVGESDSRCTQQSLCASKSRLDRLNKYIPDYELPDVSLKISSMPIFNKNLQQTVESVIDEKSDHAKSSNLKADNIKTSVSESEDTNSSVLKSDDTNSIVLKSDDTNSSVLKSNEQKVCALESDVLQFKFSKPIERRDPTLLQKFISDAVVHFKFKEPIDHRDSQSSTVPLQANMTKCLCMNNSSVKNPLKTKSYEIEESEMKGVPPYKKSLLNESVNKALKNMSEISEEPHEMVVDDNRNALFSKASSVTSAGVPLNKSMKYPGKEAIQRSDCKMSKTSSANGPILRKTSNSWKCDACISESPLFTNQCTTCGNVASSVLNKSNAFVKLRDNNDKPTSFTFPSLVSTTVPTTSNIKFGTSDQAAKLDTEMNLPATKVKSDVLSQTAESQMLTLENSKPKTLFTNPAKPVEKIKSPSSSEKTSLTSSKSVDVKMNTGLLSSANTVNVTETTATPQEGFKFAVPTKCTGDRISAVTSTKSNEVVKPNSSTLNSTKNTPPTLTKNEIKSSLSNSGFDGFKSVTTTAACVSDIGKNTSTYESSSYSAMKTKISNSNPFGKAEFDANKQSSISSFASFPPKNTPVSLSENKTVSASELFSKNVSSKHLQPSSGAAENPKDKLGFPPAAELSKVSQVISTTESPKFSSAQFSFTTSNFTNPFSTPVFTQDKQASTSTSLTLPTTTQAAVSTNSASSGFVFGNQNSGSFGSSSLVASTSANAPKNSGIFTFGCTPATDSTKRTEGFSFKSSEKTEKQNFTPSSNIFGKAANFTFGPSSSQPSGGFSPANLKSVTTTTTPVTFSFGSTAVTKSTFSPFQLPQTSTTSISTFAFGNKSSSTTAEISAFKPTSTGGFQFGTKPSENTNAQSSFLNASPAFSSSTAFGTNSVAPTFGTSQPAGGFNFGTTVSSQPSSLPFTFGSPSAKKQATGAPQANEFSFTSARTDTNGGFPPNFNIATPPSFNFGAASTPTNQPFHFAATAASSVTAPPQAARKFRKAVRRGRRDI